MCGIAGFWNPRGLEHDAREVIQRMTDAIRHRGPDGEGFWLDPEAGIALGHRRLAILDLSPAGAQPMVSPSGRYVMTYNGEIYNWRELRAQEEGHGARWRGHSDTEVFLALCDRVGIERAIQASNGMFAIGIWDRHQRSLTLVRDRIGEKPLYYGWYNGVLLFGSELKALLATGFGSPEVDPVSIAQFLRFGYVPAPHSIYSGLRKVEAGCAVTVVAGPNRVERSAAYWSLLEVRAKGVQSPFVGSDAELDERLQSLIRQEVARQSIADVPLGCFLSGGIDSSLVTAAMQEQSHVPVRTFSLGFTQSHYDEAPFARDVAQRLGTEHTEVYVTPEMALDLIPMLPTAFDEPFADSSQLPTILVSRIAKRDVTVSLSGDGGDEAFGGYTRYVFANALGRKLEVFPQMARSGGGLLLNAAARLGIEQIPYFARRGVTSYRLDKLALVLRQRDKSRMYRSLVSQWQEPSRALIAEVPERDSPSLGDVRRGPPDFLREMMTLDALTYLPDDICVKVDRAAMSTSLEVRAPFLGVPVVEFATSIPTERLIQGREGKVPLRRVLRQYLPQELIDRPKTGFGVPLASWLRGPLLPYFDELLASNDSIIWQWIRKDAVARLWALHTSRLADCQTELWPIFVLSQWATP